MEYSEDINQRIAKNLIRYRKAANLTQAELAEKINYSDKSVSKWESGNGVPDVYVLIKLSELYGVTVNDLVHEPTAPPPSTGGTTLQRVLIMLLSSVLVWLVAIVAFVTMNLIVKGKPWWLFFVYAVVANAIVIIVLASVWKYRLVNFSAVTLLIWTGIFAVFITSYVLLKAYEKSTENLGLIFIIGVPLQVLEVLWVFFRTSLRLKKPKKDEKESKKKEKENNE
jgi:transcriptional regulator with XRE-family HTH domain